MKKGPIHRTAAGIWEVTAAVRGVQMDSRRVKPGDVFVAIPGLRVDGHQFVGEAISRGAIALVVERPLAKSFAPTIVVPSARQAAAQLAAIIYRWPGRSLVVSGVTGTNGKTSVVFWLRYLLQASGSKTGMLSSVSNIMEVDRIQDAQLTTPEAPDIQRALAQMREGGMTRAVIEVSSHGLVQHRVDEIPFQVAVLTNVTREHLDYHGSMASYIQAKSVLFTRLMATDGTAVFNADDPYSQQIRQLTGRRALTYGIDQGSIRAQILAEEPWQTVVAISTPDGERDAVTIPVPGRYNVYNVLAALTGAVAQGVDIGKLLPHIAELPKVPGRLEVAAQGDGITVLVDYAHTPDGLTQVLRTVRHLVSDRGRIWLVLGARGGRDRGKRPIMGAVAARLADAVILTTDSPHHENPADIAADIEAGIREEGDRPYAVELNRRRAIRLAVRDARPGDIVLITGRGPETDQNVKGELIRLLDGEASRDAMDQRVKSDGGKNADKHPSHHSHSHFQ